MAEPFPRLSAELLPAGTRIACRIEYNGAAHNGWQTQPHLDVSTVQQELEATLEFIQSDFWVPMVCLYPTTITILKKAIQSAHFLLYGRLFGDLLFSLNIFSMSYVSRKETSELTSLSQCQISDVTNSI